MTTHSKRAAIGYIDPRRAAVIKAIRTAMPGTQTQIVARTGIHKATVCKVVGLLYADKQAHITGWEPHPVRGPSIPIYADGPGEDAIDDRPRLTKTEISRRFEERIKGTVKGDTRRAKQRNVYWRRKAKAAPNPWFGALPGALVVSMNAEG